MRVTKASYKANDSTPFALRLGLHSPVEIATDRIPYRPYGIADQGELARPGVQPAAVE